MKSHTTQPPITTTTADYLCSKQASGFIQNTTLLPGLLLPPLTTAYTESG